MRLLPLPAMMPATWVPWPYASPAVFASGFVTAEATTRDPPLVSQKSGRLPSIPVSMTATPTPRPVADAQARGARTEYGYAVAGAPAPTASGRLELRTPALTVRPATAGSPNSSEPAPAGRLAARPWMIGSAPVTRPPAARTIARPS